MSLVLPALWIYGEMFIGQTSPLLISINCIVCWETTIIAVIIIIVMMNAFVGSARC